MPELISHDGDGGIAHCSRCGAVAVGPCARCRAPICGDCCVLTEGGASTWAICLACDDRGGRTLGGAWRGLVLWLVGILVVLLALVVGLGLLAR
ncbi:MAG: hypothetical protein L6Q84_21290 [Polyangiaceae bacterium]|nr:hypothetical protein [Polyangiaceae bacterium]